MTGACRVEFVDPAIDDLLGFDPSVQKRILKKLLHLQADLAAGLPLGRRAEGNLTGLRKLVVGNRDWRIIYRPMPTEAVAEVWVIGKRGDDSCYREAVRRVQALGDSPHRRSLEEALQLVSSTRQDFLGDA